MDDTPNTLIRTPPPLSLYVHLPWCVRKCPYCDFNSHPIHGHGIDEQAYLAALIDDLESQLPRIWGRTVHTVFIGGGTPSVFSAAALDELLCQLRARLLLRADAEITLEANPGAVDSGRFRGYRDAGINRLSLGIQSFNDTMLKKLGRIHDGQAARAAFEAARAAGFSCINLDLMYGLPGQTPTEAAHDLATAVALQPEHISYYQLTIEPNTAFAHHPPPLPDDQELWAMHHNALEYLTAHGYSRYEISAYAQKAQHCHHNLNYWHFGDYLGIGAGAHGKLTLPRDQTIIRLHQHRHPTRYCTAADKTAGTTVLTPDDLKIEFALNAFRLTDGFSPTLFQERTGLPLKAIGGPLQQAVQQGLIEYHEHWIRPTELGQRFLNDLIGLFLP